MVLDSLHRENLSAQSFRPPSPTPSSPSRHLQPAEEITLTIANVWRVDRVVRGPVVAGDAPLAVDASGVMLKDSGLEGHHFRTHVHLLDLLTASGSGGSSSAVSAHRRPKSAQNSTSIHLKSISCKLHAPMNAARGSASCLTSSPFRLPQMVTCPEPFGPGGWEQPLSSQQESTARSFMPLHELTSSQSPGEWKSCVPTSRDSEERRFGAQGEIQRRCSAPACPSQRSVP